MTLVHNHKTFFLIYSYILISLPIRLVLINGVCHLFNWIFKFFIRTSNTLIRQILSHQLYQTSNKNKETIFLVIPSKPKSSTEMVIVLIQQKLMKLILFDVCNESSLINSRVLNKKIKSM